MPATHSRRCALPGRDLSSSTTTRTGLRSARRAPSDRERIRISNILAAQGRAPPAANGGLGTASRTSSGRLGTKRAAGTSPPATVTKAPRTTSKAAKTARSAQRSGTSRASGQLKSATARRAQQHRNRVEAAAAAFEASVQAEIAQDAMPPPPPRQPTAGSAGPPPAAAASGTTRGAPGAAPPTVMETALARAQSGPSAPSAPLKIVIIGAPCAGKSATLPKLQLWLQQRGVRCMIVREVATEVLQATGGYNPAWAGTQLHVEFQRRLLLAQLQAEDTVTGFAAMHGERTVILCDSGALSGAAYSSEAEWNEVLRQSGWTSEGLSARYDKALCLQSLAEHGDGSRYETTSNPARFHTATQARAVGPKLRAAYAACSPAFIRIGATIDDKVSAMATAVAPLLGLDSPTQEVDRFYGSGPPQHNPPPPPPRKHSHPGTPGAKAMETALARAQERIWQLEREQRSAQEVLDGY
eukprot:SAG31_NODE_7650_length_1629_cov_8.367974_1_plen_470_part_00